MVGGGDGWQQLMGPVGGSGGWLGEKNSKNCFVPNELKRPKNNMSFFVFIHIWGWVGVSDPIMDKSIYFLFIFNPSLMHNQIFLIREDFNKKKQ